MPAAGGWVSGSAGTVPAGIPAGCAASGGMVAEVWPPGGMVAASVGTVAELASAAFCNGPLGFSAKCAMPLTPPPTTPPPMAPIAPPKAVSCSASGVVGFWYPESCSIGFWTSSSAPSIAAPFTSPLPTAPRKVSAPSLSLSALNPPFFMAESAHSCGPNLVSIAPTVAAPSAAIALLLASASLPWSAAICVSRIPEYDGSAAAAIGPTFAMICPAPATTGAAGPVNGAAAVIPVPSTRAPSMVPMEPAAFPTASLTAVQGLSTIPPRLFTAV